MLPQPETHLTHPRPKAGIDDAPEGALATWQRVVDQLARLIDPDIMEKHVRDLRFIADIRGTITIAARRKLTLDRVCAEAERQIRDLWRDHDPLKRPIRMVCFRDLPEDTRCLVGDPWSEPGMTASIDAHGTLTYDTFVVGACNSNAVEATRAILDGTAAPGVTFIAGEPGVGKTHLARALLHAIAAADPARRCYYKSAEEFVNEFVGGSMARDTRALTSMFRMNDVVVVDDLQWIVGKSKSDPALFANIRAVTSRGGHVVITASALPCELTGISRELASELRGATTVEIGLPDAGMRRRIAQTHIALFRANAPLFDPDEALVDQMVSRVRGPARDLTGAIASLYTECGRGSRRPGQAELDAVLQRQTWTPPAPTVALVKKAACRAFGYTMVQLDASRGAEALVYVRHLAMYEAREAARKSFPQLAKMFNKSDHTTIMNAHKKFAKLVEDGEPDALGDLARLRETIYEMQLEQR